MRKSKLVGLFAAAMLAVIAILASVPASCQGTTGGNEYWIVIDKPLDSEVKDWKPQFRGPNAKVLDKLSLKPGDTVRVKVTGVNELLYELTTTMLVKPVPSSTAGLDYFMGKFGQLPISPSGTAQNLHAAATTTAEEIKNMRELPTHLVATMVTLEADWQKGPTGPNKKTRDATWVGTVVSDCKERVSAGTAPGAPTVDNIIEKGASLGQNTLVTDRVEFHKRVTMAGSIFEKVLAMKGQLESGVLMIPEGNADCDVRISLVPVSDVEGEPVTYYENKAPKKPTNINPGDLATREKTFSVSEGERKQPSGSAGVIFNVVRDSSYGVDKATSTIVERGDRNEATVAPGYLHHFRWDTKYVTIGVGTGPESLTYFLGLSSAFGNKERPGYVSLGYGLTQVLRLKDVSVGQTWTENTIPTQKIYRGGLAIAVSFDL